MDLRFSIYACVLFAGGAGIWIVREIMTVEVDERLPEAEKIRRTMWNRTGLKSGEMSRMWQAHQQFFPDSRLRFWYIALCFRDRLDVLRLRHTPRHIELAEVVAALACRIYIQIHTRAAAKLARE
jgi:hypothetical protein